MTRKRQDPHLPQIHVLGFSPRFRRARGFHDWKTFIIRQTKYSHKLFDRFTCCCYYWSLAWRKTPKLREAWHELQLFLMLNVWWAREFFGDPICRCWLMTKTPKVVPTESSGGFLYYSFDLECIVIVKGLFRCEVPFPVTAMKAMKVYIRTIMGCWRNWSVGKTLTCSWHGSSSCNQR